MANKPQPTPFPATLTEHEKHELRTETVQNILRDVFNLQGYRMIPLAYDPGCPFTYNNHVFHITLEEPINANYRNPVLAIACVPLPINTSEIIIRLPNVEATSSIPLALPHSRAENEVAALTLFRDALSPKNLDHLIPKVFGWENAKENEAGWIAMESMVGQDLDQSFEGLDLEKKKNVTRQVAEVFAAIQSYNLPDTVKGCGRLHFRGADGDVETVPRDGLKSAGADSIIELYRELLIHEFRQSEKSNLVQGWKRTDNEIDIRLANFLSQGLQNLLSRVDAERRLIHADFTTNNILIDPSTHKLTAILDFDFSFIAHPLIEHIRSLSSFHSNLPPPLPSTHYAEVMPIKDYLISGNFPSADLTPELEIAKLWSDELQLAGVKRICDYEEHIIKALSEVEWLVDAICPFHLSEPVVIANATQEKLASQKERQGMLLDKFLTMKGF